MGMWWEYSGKRGHGGKLFKSCQFIFTHLKFCREGLVFADKLTTKAAVKYILFKELKKSRFHRNESWEKCITKLLKTNVYRIHLESCENADSNLVGLGWGPRFSNRHFWYVLPPPSGGADAAGRRARLRGVPQMIRGHHLFEIKKTSTSFVFRSQSVVSFFDELKKL